MKRSEWIWPLGLLAVLLLGYGFIPSPCGDQGLDSFNEDGGGKKAFYLLTQSLLPDVGRNAEGLIPQDDNADTLVLLGPARYPDRAQWQTLYDWVAEGRSLVFATRYMDPAVDLGPFGLEVKPYLDWLTDDESDNGEGDEADAEATEPEPVPADASLTELVSGNVDWRTNGYVAFTSPDATIEVSEEGYPQVVRLPVGDGVIVVSASDFIFSNRSLATKGDNGLLAFRLIETAVPLGPVYFDEAMNAAGAPKVVGMLFEEPFRVLTIQLLIVVLLYGWMSSRRFGPPASPVDPARRSLLEHARALGNLHFKIKTGGQVVATYMELFRRELGLRYEAGKGGSGHLAPAEGVDAESSAVLQRALRTSKSPVVPPSQVARVIRELAQLRDRTSPKKGVPDGAENASPTADDT